MNIFRRLVRFMLVTASLSAWMFYLIVSADIPINMSSTDIGIFVFLFVAVIVFECIELVIFIIKKSRVGYITLIFELIVLCIWMMTFCGTNFRLSDDTIRMIVWNGILTSGFEVLFQAFMIVRRLCANQRLECQ